MRAVERRPHPEGVEFLARRLRRIVTEMRGTAERRRIGPAWVTTVLLTVGCNGTIGPLDVPPEPGSSPRPSVPATPTPSTPAQPEVPAPPLGDAFTVTRGSVQLLPFPVRLSKLAAIVQVPTTDPLLAPVVAARVTLGDHDYAHGIPADRSWTASKVTAWVAAVRPICASTQFRARYPTLPGDLGALIEAAYGRDADAEDHAAIEEALAELPAEDAEARYTAVCLAVLSSMELVAQ